MIALAEDAVSGRQLFWSMVLLVFPTVVLLLPGDLLRLGGRYGWCTPLAASVPAAALVGGVGWIGSRWGALDVASRQGWGRLGAWVPLGLLWAGVGAYAVVVTSEFAQIALSTFALENVSLPVLTGLGLLVAGLAAWEGLEVLARGAELVVPVLLLVFAAILALALGSIHPLWALPLWPRRTAFAHIRPLALTAVFLVEPVLGVLVVDQLAPGQRRRVAALLAGASLLTALLTALGIWVMVADLGPVRGGAFFVPLFSLARETAFGPLVAHAEVFLLPSVLLGNAGKMALFYWLWARAGAGLSGGGARWWLLGELLVGGVAASLINVRGLVVLDRLLWAVLARGALPALLLAVGLGYGPLLLRRRARRPAAD